MTLPLFVVDPAAFEADSVVLDGDEGHHAAVVQRLRVGEHLTLTDGTGRGADCVVTAVSRGTLQLRVLTRRHEPAPAPRLVVVQALPKGDRGERAVELLTEVGVDVVVPWTSTRTVVAWKGERGLKALRRWRSTAKAAAKQSRRLRVPEVRELHTTEALTDVIRPAAAAYLLHEHTGSSVADVAVPASGDLVLVVGPEGGIDDAEMAALGAAGAVPLRLGSTVLRSSTAGGVAAAALLSRSPRWS